jgi:hypothetical protein
MTALDALDTGLSRLRVWAWPREWTRYLGVPPLVALALAVHWTAFRWVVVATLAVGAPLLVAYERDRLRAARAAGRPTVRPLAVHWLLVAGAAVNAVLTGQAWQAAVAALLAAGVALSTVLGLRSPRPSASGS